MLLIKEIEMLELETGEDLLSLNIEEFLKFIKKYDKDLYKLK